MVAGVLSALVGAGTIGAFIYSSRSAAVPRAAKTVLIVCGVLAAGLMFAQAFMFFNFAKAMDSGGTIAWLAPQAVLANILLWCAVSVLAAYKHDRDKRKHGQDIAR